MDAFSVSVANAISDPSMKRTRMFGIAGCFAMFQTAMPLLGWICVRSISELFRSFSRLIPWIALVLLLFLGGKMLLEGLQKKKDESYEPIILSSGALFLQGIATSIDAASTGFVISDYPFPHALTASLIIGAVTLLICLGGLFLGRRFSSRLSRHASILGGIILIVIGIEIFLKGIL
ncbi:MAG: manganese efflux pump [Oscillospiraceae bacterium]|nr:manganese efflux pump [Oscillospiraceae bacterium]